jgi:hypothetical protein
MTFSGRTASKRSWHERVAMTESLFFSVIIPNLERLRFLSRTLADLLQFGGREASRAHAGLFTGIRKCLLSGKSTPARLERRTP